MVSSVHMGESSLHTSSKRAVKKNHKVDVEGRKDRCGNLNIH